MARRIFALIFLLTVGNLTQCQDWENLLFIKIGEVLETQEAALSQLKGMQEKLEHIEGKLQEMQENQEHTKGKLQEIQEKQEHFEGQLQGAVNSNQDFLERQQELETSLSLEISGVISLLKTGGIDECSDGSHNCSDHASCIDKFLQFSCLCLPGFAGDGLLCEDIDECAQGKDKCSPMATCRNSVGSYSCSCNPPFEGDGRTCNCPSGFAEKGSDCEDIDECSGQGKAECSPHATCRNYVGSYSCSCNPPFEGDGRTCEFPCRSPAKVYEGLGCVKLVMEDKTFEGMKAFCHQAGGRLLQNLSYGSLQVVRRAFGYDGWGGVHNGKWQESGLPLQEELWEEGSPRGSDPSGRRKGLCGLFKYIVSPDFYKVSQIDCSKKSYGYCQFVTTPQK